MISGTPSATRRMHSLQRQAGRYFYQWACHIGEQLAKILEIEDEKDKRDAKIEDTMEDFFDDGENFLDTCVRKIYK